jgi:hypothetical protein
MVHEQKKSDNYELELLHNKDEPKSKVGGFYKLVGRCDGA